MSAAKIIPVRHSLADQIRKPGGRTAAECVTRAQEALDEAHDKVMESIESLVKGLEATCAQRPADPADRVYDEAHAILDLAGFFDTGSLYGVAYSLCELSDSLRAQGRWDWTPVMLHVQALRLVLKADGDPAAQALVAGLGSLTSHVTGKPD